MRRVERVDATEAPADHAHLALVAVVHEAQFLLECVAELELEAGVLPEAPGLDVVATRPQEGAEAHQRRVARGEAGDQQDGVTVPLRGIA
jgi:hypothetical protein